MKKSTLPIPFALLAILLIAGCATPESVTSSSVTRALDLQKTDRFAVTIPDTADMDTAFSSQMQEVASSELIEELEEYGFDYVGERNPQIRAILRTYPAVQASYLDASLTEKITVTTTEETRNRDGSVTTVSKTQTVPATDASEPIYLPANTRIFLLDIYDVNTETLLWRGYITEDDTSLDAEQLDDAIDKLVERLDEEA
ncbi:hypothetical protein [Pelagicoccus sp. SDUM812002]|uniref:hypothetical protein n=1 Tax=Pelagicoccus sp. SDUM812002 TaxID=3041266 RepID=UPI00280F7FB8|nr:hypothetical protein [Pelagicoccus sp. SDUM812002]MDQ8187736.1 hypothetical protein [Pelagicoccus sp. SDUM812002]